MPTITYTSDGIPGDPLNVGAVATERELKALMIASKWYPADPLTLESCLEIAEATVLKRPYDEAPVSNLFLWKRKEDLAFEKPVGDNPRHRHHVRFWKSEKTDGDGRPVWVGAATYDRAVGLSHTTGQITHHIAADVDAERNGLMNDWRATGRCSEFFDVPNFQKAKEGRNGGGDPWHTDETLEIGVVRPE
ncbi:MAG: LssY C-terminal domain-containing protein [Pirellulales bacterium]